MAARPSRFSSILGPLRLVWPSIKFHYNALKEALRKDGVASLIRPRKIREAAIARLFSITSGGFIAFENTTIVPSLLRSAYGKVLELGPGPGNQIHRFDPATVDFIYGVEPNPLFAADIDAKLKKADLHDKYKFIACGIEDSDVLRAEGITEGSVDTVLSIQVLCAVDDPGAVMREVWKLLKPGGSFVFWEHVKNKDTATGLVQACWNPAWSRLAGCHLNRHLLEDILAAGEWENPGDIAVEDNPYTWLPRISGVLKKKA